MSNRLFQGIVHQLTDSIDRTIGVIDESGTIISCSELGKIGEVLSTEVTAVFSGTEVISVDGYSYKPFGARMHPEYAVFVSGDDDLALKYLSMLAVTLSSIKQYYDENTTAQTLSRT